MNDNIYGPGNDDYGRKKDFTTMTQPPIPEGETQHDYNYEYQTFGDRWNPIYYLDCYTTTQFKEKYPKARYRVAKTKLSEITICAINHFRMSGVISNLETHVSDFIAGAEWQKAQAGGEWIDIEKKLPGCLATDLFTGGTKVWVLGEDKIWISQVMDAMMWKYYMQEVGVTHWMPFDAIPLPEPPMPQ